MNKIFWLVGICILVLFVVVALAGIFKKGFSLLKKRALREVVDCAHRLLQKEGCGTAYPDFIRIQHLCSNYSLLAEDLSQIGYGALNLFIIHRMAIGSLERFIALCEDMAEIQRLKRDLYCLTRLKPLDASGMIKPLPGLGAYLPSPGQ